MSVPPPFPPLLPLQSQLIGSKLAEDNDSALGDEVYVPFTN